MSCLNSLVVKVERATCNPRSPFKTVFEVHKDIDMSLNVPYEQIANSLRFLYGSDCVITFSSRLLTLKHV